jgi:peptide/nickel transport system permease protein
VLAIPTLLGASIIVFAMVHLAPGDPISAILPVDASQEQIEDIKKAYGFDKPLPVQYLKWLGRVVQGDLGKSIATRRAVILDVRDSLANSLVLAVSSSVLAFGSASRSACSPRSGRAERSTSFASAMAVIGVSVPHYWAGIILIIIFSVQLNWLPGDGRVVRRRTRRVPPAHDVAHDCAGADPARRHRARDPLGGAGHPQPGVRPRPAREGTGPPPRLRDTW